MGQIFGCLAVGASWCFCTALGSLLSSCCATNKDSSVPPGVASGRKRSIFLLILSIGFSFFYQYFIGPNVLKYNNEIGPLGYVGRSWLDGCDQYSNNTNSQDDSESSSLQKVCAGQSGVYRAAGSAFLFFILAAIAAFCKPTANRDAWVAKYTLFLFLVVGTVFIPNTPLFTPILMNIFRVGAVIFMIFNQLIILDICFNLNESWVEKADRADVEEEPGAGKKWLGTLLALCATLYIGCFVAIGLMYAFFGGCSTNVVFITITLIMGLVSTGIQLTGEEASLFTSASIFTYSTYLLYTAVSKNTNAQCNPQLGDEDILGIIFGVGLTLIGVLWTGFSSTAYKSVGAESDEIQGGEDIDGDKEEKGEKKSNNDYDPIDGTDQEDGDTPLVTFSTSWKINVILASICCWFAMVLTSWGSIQGSGSVANPQAGQVSMWMVIASQWLIITLYLWTLIAPKLFPNRDFS